MIEQLTHFKNIASDVWENAPWIRAAGILGFTIGGLTLLNSELPAEIAVDLSNSDFKKSAPVAVTIMYFFLVSIFSGDRLRFEKKLRALEQNFKYDNRGTLFNGRQPNIAFRITTFKGILEGILAQTDSEKLIDTMTQTGKSASTDFANNLEDIYNNDVASRKAKSYWEDLTVTEKLNQWADYDSSTGWGILACTIKKNNVKVVINHLHSLFEDDGGLLFGAFLAGYSETIVGSIIRNHTNGKYDEFTGCVLERTNHSDKYTLELEYKLI